MNSLSTIYNWNTSLQWGSEIVDRENIKKINLELDRYETFDTDIKLKDLEIEFLTKRQTKRNFSSENKNISFDELSTLLNNSVRQRINLSEIKCASPSAGGLYPIKTYLLVNKVEGVKKGIYSYNPRYHALSYISNLNKINCWENVFLNQSFTKKERFCLAFLFVLEYEVIFCKYKERGYRYSLIEVGHIAQNIQLIASEKNLSSVPVGGFIDFDVNQLLKLDLEKYLPLYSVFIGIDERRE